MEKKDNVECEEFYNLMQIYRHSPITKQEETVVAYENVKEYIERLLKRREMETKKRLYEDYMIGNVAELHEWEESEDE